ncbi:MAG: hypothetical protein O3B86_13560 [Planctomycetota bacterium]|nr:hypothetical protein [Planctomycetota bacterium]
MLKPVVQAILLADHVYRDADTNKFIVAGIFNRVIRSAAVSIPKSGESRTAEKASKDAGGTEHLVPATSVMQAGNPSLYFAMTDFEGTAELEFHYVDLSDHSILFRLKGTLKFPNRFELVQGKVPIPKLPIPHPGQYSLDVLSDGEILGGIRIVVVDASGESDDEPDN